MANQLSGYTQPLPQAEKLDAVEGMNLLITAIRTINTKFGEAVIFTATDESGATHEVLTSGIVVMPALKAAASDLPVSARFIKSGRAWTVLPTEEGEGGEEGEQEGIPF